LRAAQLFVRCSSLEELGEGLARSLRRGGPREDADYLALHQAPWGTVVSQRPDPRLAKLLSERFGTALSLWLDGGALALSVQTWEAGQPGEEERDPRPPRFRDVEAAAWELLRYLGVPAALRLLPLAGIEVLRSAAAGLPAVLARAGERVEVSSVAAVPPPRPEGPAPVDPDVVVESRAGERRALEVRDLPGGIPTEAWAQALAEIEEAQAGRLLRALADSDEPRLPRPTFAYRTLQALRMEKLLARARGERPWLAKLSDPEREPPFSRAGFTQLCRSRLAGARVARAHGPRLELFAGAACVRAPVHEMYEVYLSTLDAEAAAAQLAAAALALAQEPPPPVARWDAAAEKLLPTLLSGDPGPRAALEVAPFLHAALLCDDGVRIAPVLSADLEALGLEADDAFERAIANLDALTEAAPEGIRWFDLDHGRVVSCEFADAGGAGRLLSPRARELLLTILGEETALAAAPTRDALLACAVDDEEGAAWLRDEAHRRCHEGPFAIHPGLWLISADLIRPVAGPGAGPSGDEEGRSA
jgi:hypothetical protein